MTNPMSFARHTRDYDHRRQIAPSPEELAI
jgi:hypothetical protein